MIENTGRPEILLHPVRIRIVAEFVGHQRTVRELAAAMPDVPQASLYRHVGALAAGGVLELVEERPARGPSERVYRVAPGADRIRPEEVDALPPAELRRLFAVFTASLIDSFATYVGSGHPVPSADGLAVNRAVVNLSDEERTDFGARFGDLVGEVLALPPGRHRRRYHVASCFIPAPEAVA